MLPLIALASFTIAALFAWRCCHPSSYFYLLDEPCHRSLHTEPKPHTGGLAILAGITAGIALLSTFTPLPFILSTSSLALAGVACISFLDDWKDVFFGYRLAIHFSAAALLINAIGCPATLTLPNFTLVLNPWLAWMISILFTVWMLNLFNFMDGLDGLAGTMTCLGFGTLALIGWLEDKTSYCAVNGIIACSSAGFLLHNLPPSKLFMGDAGACSLGFLAAATSLWGMHNSLFPTWIPLLIFAPFIVDATTTLSGRLLRLEKVWIGERNHFYHKLLLRLDHKRTLAIEATIIAATCLSALLSYNANHTTQWSVIIAWTLTFPTFFLIIQRYAENKPILDKMQN